MTSPRMPTEIAVPGAGTIRMVNLDHLDELLLDGDGRMRLLPAAALLALPPMDLRLWAFTRGRYTLPTVELVAWLRSAIGHEFAVEVGAGMGDLGHHLGISMTDSYVQVDNAELKAQIAHLFGQCPTSPPRDVERMTANAAVDMYSPDVVIGSWIMQVYQDGDQGPPRIDSSVYGTDEFALLRKTGRYIHIGNDGTTRHKRLLALPHKLLRFPWLVSRSQDQAANAIRVWTNPARER